MAHRATPADTIRQIQAIHVQWERSAARLHQAMDAAARGEMKRAAQEYEALLRDDPEYPLAHFQLAQALDALGDRAAALDHALTAIELGLRHPNVIRYAIGALRALAAANRPGVTPLRKRLEAVRASHPQRLSVTIITKDEEENLPRCLRSVEGVVSQMIVVDTGSTDRTVEIAHEFGAEVFFYEWRDDFAAARNESLRHATGDWILWLDADEELMPESREPLGRLLYDEEVAGAHLRIDNLTAGQTIPFLTTRLWRHHPAVRFKQPIHEQIHWAIAPLARRFGRKVVEAPHVVIRHYGYHPGVARARRKDRRNLLLIEMLVEREPENAYALFHYGCALRHAGRREEALRVFRRWEPVAEAQPESERHWLAVGFANYAATLNELGFHGEAHALTTRTIERIGPTASLRYQRALALHHLGRPAEALSELDAAEKTPRTVNTSVESVDFQPILVPMLTADVYLALGETERARAFFQRAAELDPEDPRPLCGLARLAIADGKLEEGAAQLERAIQRRPDEPHALEALAQVELYRRRFDRAIALLRRAAPLDSQGEATRLLGETLLLAGRPEEAETAWASCPDAAPVAGCLAFLHAANGQPEAIEELRDPRTDAGFWMLIDKALTLNKREEIPGIGSVLALARVVASEPRFHPLRTKLLRLFLKHRFTEGVRLFRQSPAHARIHV